MFLGSAGIYRDYYIPTTNLLETDFCPLQVDFETFNSLILSGKNNFQLKHGYATLSIS